MADIRYIVPCRLHRRLRRRTTVESKQNYSLLLGGTFADELVGSGNVDSNKPTRSEAAPRQVQAFRRLGRFQPCTFGSRFANQPLTIMLMLLSGAGAAKSGYGVWAASGLLALLPVYFGTLVTCIATRSIANWVDRMRCHEGCQTAA
jgi:hypothetical protein